MRQITTVTVLSVSHEQLMKYSAQRSLAVHKEWEDDVTQWLEHCVSRAKVVGSIPREHTYMYSLNAL